MIKRLIVAFLVLVLSINIALADPAVDSFKGKTILGGIIELSWTVSDPTDSLDYVELYRGAEFLKKFDIDGGKYSDLYNDNSVKAGESYDYRIVAYNTNGNKVESLVHVTVDNVPPKLTSPKTIITNQKTITIETDENSYCAGGFKGGNGTMLEGNNTTSHQLSLEFVEGQNIISVVCADGSSNEFSNPEDMTVIFDTTKPSKPSLAAKFEDDKAKLSWDASTDGNGIKAYNIYRSPDGATFDQAGNVAQTSFEEAVQATVYYAVGAVDNAGNEERSDVKVIEIKPASAPAVQSAAVVNPPAQPPAHSKFPVGAVIWIGFIVLVLVGVVAYFNKKKDKFGLDSYMHKRSKMR